MDSHKRSRYITAVNMRSVATYLYSLSVSFALSFVATAQKNRRGAKDIKQLDMARLEHAIPRPPTLLSFCRLLKGCPNSLSSLVPFR